MSPSAKNEAAKRTATGRELAFRGERLRARMDELGFSRQEDFADASSLPQPEISAYLAGRKDPSTQRLKLICKAAACSADWLIGLTDVPPPPPVLRRDLAVSASSKMGRKTRRPAS